MCASRAAGGGPGTYIVSVDEEKVKKQPLELVGAKVSVLVRIVFFETFEGSKEFVLVSLD